MRRSLFAAMLVATAMSSQTVCAQTPKSAAQAPQPAAASVDPADFDRQLAQVHEHMQQMQAQMTRIQQTQDPQERQRLLLEHWTSMQAAMVTMHGMWSPGRMGCCMGNQNMGPGMMMNKPMMGWSHMQGYYKGLTPEQLRQRQYMTDQYLPMQQMMMDHLMWHQRWLTQPPVVPTK